jgi:alanyl-tRNA synthetase
VLVEDTVKVQAAVHGHQGRIVEGEVEVGDVFVARVDAERAPAPCATTAPPT